MPARRSAKDFVSSQVEASRLFFLSPGAGEFAVVFGGYERCSPDYQIDREDVPWFCLEFVAIGRGWLALGDSDEWELQPGRFYLYGPGLAHRIRSSTENPMGKYFVGFNGAGALSFLAKHGLHPGFQGRCAKGEAIRRTFDTLIERGVRKSPNTAELCSLMTRQLILLCRDDAAGEVDDRSPAYATYQHARWLMEDGFLRFSSLEQVAAECGTDPAYLCRLFSRYHDESPYRYLTRMRMEHAARLLIEGGGSVRSVASELGFRDAFHFSRVFKSVHHVPPSRFRRVIHPR